MVPTDGTGLALAGVRPLSYSSGKSVNDGATVEAVPWRRVSVLFNQRASENPGLILGEETARSNRQTLVASTWSTITRSGNSTEMAGSTQIRPTGVASRCACSQHKNTLSRVPR